jgi:phosphopantothenoylcysteine decarboxylase/phosphopantothenate--cysteine ligase
MKILVGISGSIGVLSISSYLVNLLVEEEVEDLRLVMTPTAARFVHPRALEALVRRPIFIDSWTDEGRMVSPPELVQDLDLYLIAPASATTLSRCAAGSGETVLAQCYLCHRGAVAFAPCMAPEMLSHPAVVRNLERLEQQGACILPPGPAFQVSTGTLVRSGICPYRDMWPILRSLVRQRPAQVEP